MNLVPLLIVIAFSSDPVPAAHHNDWLIVPGKRLGPITPDSTRADLDRFFGKENVRDQPVDSGQGDEPATQVYPTTPETTLSIFWKSTKIRDIVVCYPESTNHCKWHTKEGITLGSTFEKLEALNGRPFQLLQWGSDGGGSITSWRGGHLAPQFGGGANSKLWLTLDYPQSPDGPTPEQHKWVDKVSGAGVFISSRNEAVRHLHPTVRRLVVVFSTIR